MSSKKWRPKAATGKWQMSLPGAKPRAAAGSELPGAPGGSPSTAVLQDLRREELSCGSGQFESVPPCGHGCLYCKAESFPPPSAPLPGTHGCGLRTGIKTIIEENVTWLGQGMYSCLCVSHFYGLVDCCSVRRGPESRVRPPPLVSSSGCMFSGARVGLPVSHRARSHARSSSPNQEECSATEGYTATVAQGLCSRTQTNSGAVTSLKGYRVPSN
ncbi:IQ motif and ankyrin repeat domain-containing protein 1 isoform X2 [Equus quagga]|nr:IQ motif and ankyrin repeat domain-containing protein 1 isoform X2 [Equus quagga]